MFSPSTPDNHNKTLRKKHVSLCFVPMCPSTSTKFPNKLFLTGPTDPKLRKKWFKAAKRDGKFSPKTTIRCCEDHFDLENDVENWMRYKMFGGKLFLKKDVVPHIFECQNRMMPMRPRSAVIKRNRHDILENMEITTDQEKNSTESDHLQAKHGEHTSEYYIEVEGEPVTEFVEISMKINCDQCGKEFDYKNSSTNNSESNTILCNLCREENERVYKQMKVYTCKLCRKKFTDQNYLTGHMNKAHSKQIREKPFACNICHDRFSLESSLFIHKKTHVEAFRCEICDNTFTQKSALTVHIRKHTGVKPFECGVCKLEFSQRSHLKAHERLHSGERPYSCNICNKQFSKKHHLTVHATVHSKEKPYACDICKKRFSQKSSVNVHKRRYVCVMKT